MLSPVNLELAEQGQQWHRLIFLDIDGVMNAKGQLHIDLTLLTRLLRLVTKTGAEFVLSSMWRLSRESRHAVRAAFVAVGLPRPLSYTPRMHNGHARALEIVAWLRINTENLVQHDIVAFPPVQDSDDFNERHYRLPNGSRLHCSHFCVLDDLDLLGDSSRGGDPTGLLRTHFVRTPAHYGFTENNLEQALRVLTVEGEPVPVDRLFPQHCDQCEAVILKGSECMQLPQWNKFFCHKRCQYLFLSQ